MAVYECGILCWSLLLFGIGKASHWQILLENPTWQAYVPPIWLWTPLKSAFISLTTLDLTNEGWGLQVLEVAGIHFIPLMVITGSGEEGVCLHTLHTIS